MRPILFFPDWRLFLYTGLIPIFVFIVEIYFSIQSFDSREGFEGDSFLLVGALFAHSVFTIWLLAVGGGLHRLNKVPVEMELTFFKFAVLFSFAVLVLSLVMGYLGYESKSQSSIPIYIGCSTFLLNLYAYYFVARLLNLVEKGRSVTFMEYVGDLLLVLFFFLGVWFIQRRINRIFSEEEDQMISTD